MGPGRTPTVHRCPKGKAVGGPHETTSDRRPNDTDRRQDKRAFNETGVHGTRQVLTHTWILTQRVSPTRARCSLHHDPDRFRGRTLRGTVCGAQNIATERRECLADRGKVGLQPSCNEPCSRVDQFIHDGRAYPTRSDCQRRTVAQRRVFPFAKNCDTR